MKLTLYTLDRSSSVLIQNERQDLVNLLSMLAPHAVRKLHFSDMTGDKIPRCLPALALEAITFERCHAIQSLPSEVQKCSSLKRISFLRCADLCTLNGIASLPALQFLGVSGCESFDTLPDEWASLPSLRVLDLSYCPSLTWINCQSLPPSLKILDIHGSPNVDFDDACANALALASVNVQDATRIDDLDAAPILPDIASRLRHTQCASWAQGSDE